MQKYSGIKTVSAEPMSRDEAGKLGLVRGYNPDDEDRRGYKVGYEDGYESWSPERAFEKAYRKIDGLTFGDAIEALKQGKKVTRRGWNGKGMFLWLKPATTVKSEWCRDEILKSIVDENGGEILGFSSWLASQSDMLLED